MSVSEIIVDAEAVKALVRMGDLPADNNREYLTLREDGRFNMRVSVSLRQKLDRILIMAGVGNHSDAIRAIERLAQHTGKNEQ